MSDASKDGSTCGCLPDDEELDAADNAFDACLAKFRDDYFDESDSLDIDDDYWANLLCCITDPAPVTTSVTLQPSIDIVSKTPMKFEPGKEETVVKESAAADWEEEEEEEEVDDEEI